MEEKGHLRTASNPCIRACPYLTPGAVERSHQALACECLVGCPAPHSWGPGGHREVNFREAGAVGWTEDLHIRVGWTP